MRAWIPAVSLAAVLVATGCGGGERQDADEDEGEYKVAVLEADFPLKQKLAKSSQLEFFVRNIGDKEIKNLVITFGRNTPRGRIDALDRRSADPQLADPDRPVFVVNGRPRNLGGLAESQEDIPPGSQTAYVDTYALGKLPPRKSKRFAFRVTAVVSGPYRIVWTLSAGLDGKAKAVLASGLPATGQFEGVIAEKPPTAKVSDADGKTVIKEE